ncbi:hypothetical protein LC048_24350 [Mesobacillus subterraneus]|uniref:hypothetical protein n=1 Tax=Mesobacillus subterraneus TaxID=285983 RepID=UPI001CFD0658|nr:hypothetical protein [Mesobacillus subterraneus]WLR55355.1 hypothetical protein LC048_24350 [Mesobacillus subterraneus]
MAYQIMFYGGLAGAIIALVIAVLTYVKLNIAQVITDLTGWNFPGAGRKARKTTVSRKTNTSTKPTTKEIHVRKNVEKEVAAGEYVEPTEKMASGQMEPTALLRNESFKQTALLKQDNLDPTALFAPDGHEPTALLAETPVREPVAAAVSSNRSVFHESPAETTILSDWNETTVLTSDHDETTLLGETTLLDNLGKREEPSFKKQVDIIVVHSETII